MIQRHKSLARLIDQRSSRPSKMICVLCKKLVCEAAVRRSKKSSPSKVDLPGRGTGERTSKKATRFPRKKFLDHVVVDRVKFCIGDDVYIWRTKEDIDEEGEGCLVCGKTGKLVECDKCSRGVHLKCADPPLTKIYEGEWIYLGCEAASKFCTGAHASKSRTNGHREHPKSLGSFSWQEICGHPK